MADMPTLASWLDHRPSTQPDVIVLSTSAPATIGAAAAAAPAARIVALGLHDDHLYERRARESGADAYLPRECALDRLAATVVAVTAPGGGRRNRANARSWRGWADGNPGAGRRARRPNRT